MKLENVLRQSVMMLDLKSTSKEAVIHELVMMLVEDGVLDKSNREAFESVIWEREKISSTGVGDGVAIPHGMSELISKPTVVFGKSTQGIEFNSLDGKPACLFFMIATPKNSNNDHLALLSQLSARLMNETVIQSLTQATSKQQVQDILNADVSQTVSEVDDDAPFVVAVTACATGIAHTYMAQEKLQSAAGVHHVNIKVETNGSAGVKNKLSAQDIEKAVGVIVAADIHVEMNRFAGKPLVHVPVAQAINKADSLIETIVNGNVPAYVASHQDKKESEAPKGVYQHLMNGVSHMLPFVIAGGILIAIAFMIDQIIGVPTDSLGKLGSYNELAATFNTIGGMAFGFMLPVLAGYIAMSIADRPGLVVGFVAGGLASAGGAGFLGALLGGFVSGYAMNGTKKLLEGLPTSMDGIRTVLLYPLFGVLVVGLVMTLVNYPMSALNNAMNNFLTGLSGTNAILLGLILGTMMAIDLGGPINKAAYVFGTGTLTATVSTGGSAVMAAVMAAGMVPPLGVFIATQLFKNKFTKDQQQAGLTNLILGASFITEGAIPFASSDPIPMLISFVGGSAIASALVLMSGIQVLAPHGGIFVIMLVSNPLLYIAYIAIGSVISGVLIGLLKK
ncbi:PTS fructose transporter subunit IIC [Erysipelothrix larvae]|uniref:PTS fructose transporter subunit IIC n=1 Tax=Erysipelothrix larvae TaxID=1514105 RepID=A0A109UGM5_9FIRM|nr:fructose-specific PTS transporter subunit EIIC [Erysipelothrix larvae]AMC92778.1 PTS fructose transporter subunit IIC [Erysipelothrix larvae]